MYFWLCAALLQLNLETIIQIEKNIQMEKTFKYQDETFM